MKLIDELLIFTAQEMKWDPHNGAREVTNAPAIGRPIWDLLRRKKSKWAEARRNSFGTRSEGLRKVHTKSRFFGPHLKALPLLFRFLESVSLFEATPTTPFFSHCRWWSGGTFGLVSGRSGASPRVASNAKHPTSLPLLRPFGQSF